MPQAARAAGNAAKPAPAAAAKIGALFPLSGADALAGDEALRGVLLAADAAMAAGQKLTVSPTDALDASQVEAQAKAMIEGGAQLLLGSGASSLAYPGSAAAELAQVPYIELTATADGITGRNFKFLLRLCLTTSMLAATAIAAIGERYPKAKIGLLFNTGATAGALAAAAMAQFQARKVAPLLSIGYPEDAADLHDPVARLKRAGADVILHAAGMDDVLVFFQATQDLGWRPAAVFGSGVGYGSRETAFALGRKFDGTYVSAAPFYPASAAAIAAAYVARYGMQPRSADSLTAYVGAKLVFDTLAAQGGDPGRLLDALRKTAIPAGGMANGWGVAFDKTGQNTSAFATLQQWHDGGLVTLADRTEAEKK